MGGGGGAVRGMVAVETGFGLGDLGADGIFFNADKLVPDPDDDRPRSRLVGGGGGPLLPPKRFVIDDETLELDIFRPTEGGGAGGLARVGGGGGTARDDNEGLPPLKEFLVGGGGGPFPRGVGGPARLGGGGGLLALLIPDIGRGNCGGPDFEKFEGGLGPFVEGGDVGLLAAGGMRLAILLPIPDM